MKKIIHILSIIILFSFFISNDLKASPEQNYVVYIKSGAYKVKTDITGEEVFSSKDASTSIQWAIDNIGNIGIDGGEVLIEAGEYLLNNCVIVKSNIWVRGKGKSTHLYTNGQIVEAIVIQDASMVVVSNFSLTNKNNGLKSAVGVLVERSINCQVLDVFVSDFNRGISNTGESSMTLIDGNTLINNKINIDISNGGGVIGRWLPLLISNNTIQGGEIGISCNALCTNILKNRISALSGRGIVANGNSIIVRGNKISDIKGDYAIWGNGAEFNCTDNSISNVEGGGIRSRDRWGSFTNNIITNCGTEQKPAIGILIATDDRPEGPAESKAIFRNTIHNEEGKPFLEYGIKEEGSTNVIAANMISGFSKGAILSEGKGSIVINNTEKIK